MKSAKRPVIISGVFLVTIFMLGSCKKFSTLNSDPNNITSSEAAPDYLMASVLTSTATGYGSLGSGAMSGAMQQTVQDAWGSSFSDYEWSTSDWTSFYTRLLNNKLLLTKAEADGWKFHQGVGLIMRAFNFGTIADFWGAAPDSMALLGDGSSSAEKYPVFDTQEEVYTSVIADLKAAIPFLQGSLADHSEITSTTETSDVFYSGDPAKWRRLAYSLLLRYYLRLSSKWSVESSVEAIADSVFSGTDDDWTMSFPGTDNASSYQWNSTYQGQTYFNRNKMCGTLTMKLKDLKDPRIVVMAEPITTPSIVDASQFASGDASTLTVISNGVRYINPAAAEASNYKQFDPSTYATDRPWGAVAADLHGLYDTNSVYVGIPISYSNNDFQYNINGSGTQALSKSDYVSFLREDIYDQKSGTYLKERMASYSEICFDLAEAALKGWSVGGSASDWYYKGIQASFDTWGVFTTYQTDVNDYFGCVKSYSDYIAQSAVVYNGTLEQIMEQKWIAAWQACTESWMDWRRTGYPALGIGWATYRKVLPIRYAYYTTELTNNATNANTAITWLQATDYIDVDGTNSCWSRNWLQQGTGEPW